MVDSETRGRVCAPCAGDVASSSFGSLYLSLSSFELASSDFLKPTVVSVGGDSGAARSVMGEKVAGDYPVKQDAVTGFPYSAACSASLEDRGA